jgi:Tol biopolymer transport system component
MGTVAYMSPQQVRGEPLDARTDLFSLGVVLYEMATGHQAFSGTTTGVVIDGILNREPAPPTAANPVLPAELDRILGKALEKDADVRYQTARDLLADLKRLRRDSSSGRKAVTASHVAVSAPSVTPPSGPLAAGPAGGRRRALVGGTALLAAVVFGALALRLGSGPPPLKVTEFVQITSDRRAKIRPVTDGARLYFTETLDAYTTVLAQAAVTGGDVRTIPVPFPQPFLVDISPAGTELLVLADRENLGTVSSPSPLWIVPILGGTPRPVGDLRAGDAAWSPDGKMIAYTVGGDLLLAATDGSNPRKIWTFDGRAFYPAWNPDGRRLRLSTDKPPAPGSSIWEVGADGSNPHPVLPGFEPSACCGRWTPDGRHYVFVGFRDRADLWALTEKTSWLSPGRARPVRLTQGPLNYGVPLPSRDGRRIFAEGARGSGETVRCPLGSGACALFLGGIDAEGVSFSRDGEWLAYTLPDGTLWRSRADGTEKLQLTFAPVSAALPQWSPDRRQVAFARIGPGPAPRIVLVPANGGPPQDAVPEDPGSQMDASWSPDGKRLALGRRIGLGPEDRDITIQIADLESRQVTPVPGSKGLFSPRWSPDGRFLAAVSHDSLRLLLYDFASQRWRPLLTGVLAYPTWARDGQHLFIDDGNARLRVRIADGHREVVHSYEGLRRVNRRLGVWVNHAPDDSIVTLRDTSLDEMFALELETP